MTSLRPYLLRALIDWIVDNDRTPYMVIDCSVPGVAAPTEQAQDGKLTLNISAAAVRDFALDDKHVSMDCRFQGRSVYISAPVGAVIGVYAKETGMGMGLEADHGEPASEPAPTKPKRSGKSTSQRPTLRLVK